MCLVIRQLGCQGKIEAESSFVLSAIRTHCWFHALPCSNSPLIKFAAQIWVFWIFTAIARVFFSISWGRWNGDFKRTLPDLATGQREKYICFETPLCSGDVQKHVGYGNFNPFFPWNVVNLRHSPPPPAPQILCRSCFPKKTLAIAIGNKVLFRNLIKEIKFPIN